MKYNTNPGNGSQQRGRHPQRREEDQKKKKSMSITEGEESDTWGDVGRGIVIKPAEESRLSKSSTTLLLELSFQKE